MENYNIVYNDKHCFEAINGKTPVLSAMLKNLYRESIALIMNLETDIKEQMTHKETELDKIDDSEDSAKSVFALCLTQTYSVTNFKKIFSESLWEKKLNVLEINDTCRKIKLGQANAAWRTAANIVLHSQNFHIKLLKHPVAKTMEELLKLLSVLVATGKIKGKVYMHKRHT